MGFPTTLTRPGTRSPLHPEIGAPNRTVVLEQLERLLANPLFTSSKRYPAMLRYVVENALDNPAGELKERTIGIEVFGREPSYDTNHDPVVRTSAVEVRKRLIQYYQDVAHADELRIELVVGSYVPRFHAPPGDKLPPEPLVLLPVRETEKDRLQLSWRKVSLSAALVIAAALIVFRLAQPAPPLDQFWQPLWDNPNPVVIGLSGGPSAQDAAAGDSAQQTLSERFRSRADYVPMGDVAAMARILANLKQRGRSFNLFYSNSIQLADLKSGPAILIGPMSRWLELMSKDLRFTVDRDQAITQSWINDREHPGRRDWSVQVGAPASSVAEAYALITRVWNPTTGNFMVCISGLSPYATSAAGDFVSNAKKMQDLLGSAPSGWGHKNVQIVIAATRVGTNVGIPRALATYFW